MDVLKMIAELFARNAGKSGLSVDAVMSALKPLLGGGDGSLDLPGLISKFQGAGLAQAAASWLGDGGNEAIDVGQILGALGDSNVAQFAETLGMDKDTAAEGLANAIPETIDKVSSGGSLLEGLGGVGGALGMAKKLFG